MIQPRLGLLDKIHFQATGRHLEYAPPVPECENHPNIFEVEFFYEVQCTVDEAEVAGLGRVVRPAVCASEEQACC